MWPFERHWWSHWAWALPPRAGVRRQLRKPWLRVAWTTTVREQRSMDENSLLSKASRTRTLLFRPTKTGKLRASGSLFPIGTMGILTPTPPALVGLLRAFAK